MRCVVPEPNVAQQSQMLGSRIFLLIFKGVRLLTLVTLAVLLLDILGVSFLRHVLNQNFLIAGVGGLSIFVELLALLGSIRLQYPASFSFPSKQSSVIGFWIGATLFIRGMLPLWIPLSPEVAVKILASGVVSGLLLLLFFQLRHARHRW